MINIINGMKEIIDFNESNKFRLFHDVRNHGFSSHWHTGLEIILPVKKEYTVNVNNTVYLINEGDIVFIHSGVIHSLEAPTDGERIIIQFDLSILTTIKDFDIALFMLPPVFVLKKDALHEDSKTIFSIVSKIIEEYDGSNSMKEVSIYGLLIQLYVQLCRMTFANDNTDFNLINSRQHEHIEKILSACTYIHNNVGVDLTLEHVASSVGFSKYYFSRLFKQITNVTFYTFVTQQRILKAKTLLIDPDITIIEVAMKSGFNSTSSFNRTFKSAVGCSPKEYRNKRTY